MLEIVRCDVPGFVSVTVCGALVVPTVCAANTRLVAEVLTSGWIPVPVNAITSGLLSALSAMLIWAVRVPEAFGLNVTLIVQLAPAATVVPHVLVAVKSAASAPETLMPVPGKVSAVVVLLLVNVTDCGLLGEPTSWGVLKLTAAADKVTAG